MYRVLKPVWKKAGEVIQHPGEEPVTLYNVAEWTELGVARDLEDALRKFPRNKKNGYSPILEETSVH